MSFGKYKYTTKPKHKTTEINRGETFNPLDIW
jgi:hypothetical protein